MNESINYIFRVVLATYPKQSLHLPECNDVSYASTLTTSSHNSISNSSSFYYMRMC